MSRFVDVASRKTNNLVLVGKRAWNVAAQPRWVHAFFVGQWPVGRRYGDRRWPGQGGSRRWRFGRVPYMVRRGRLSACTCASSGIFALALGLCALPLHAASPDDRWCSHAPMTSGSIRDALKLGYLGQPGGPLGQAVDVAIKEKPVRVGPQPNSQSGSTQQPRAMPADARTLMQRFEKGGCAGDRA